VPFKSLGAVSYSSSIVTKAVSVAVCDIFSIKKWCDLENRVRVRSRSLEMVPFDRSHILSLFHLIPERDGQTERRTELLYQYSVSVC